MPRRSLASSAGLSYVEVTAPVLLISIIVLSAFTPTSSLMMSELTFGNPPQELVALVNNLTIEDQKIIAPSHPELYCLSERQSALAHFFASAYSSFAEDLSAGVRNTIDGGRVALVVIDLGSGHDQFVRSYLLQSHNCCLYTVLSGQFEIYVRTDMSATCINGGS